MKLSKRSFLESYVFYGLIFPILVFLVGIKDPNLWLDYNVYKWYYDQSINNSVLEIIYNVQDPLFTLYNKIFSSLNLSFDVFILLLAFTTLFLKFWGFRNSTESFYVLLVLYSSLIIGLHDYTQVRVGFALGVLIFSIYYLRSNFFRFILISASIFLHASVIIVILPYIYYYIFKNNTKMMIVYILSTSSIFYFSLKILSEWSRFTQYLDNFTYYNFFASIPLLQSMTLIYLFCRYKKESISFEYYVSLSGVCAYYFLFLTPAAATRYMEVGSVFFIILLSKYFKKDDIIKLICLLIFIINIYNLFVKPNSFLYPYYFEFINLL